jgi:GH18 family chitinase
MDRDMVLMAKKKPDHKYRETKDGVEQEDWIYGKPPGDVVFVTFEDGQVTRVKHEHANLGGEVRKIEPVAP